MIRLAHLSDPHLGPMPPVSLSQLMNKRLLGYLNWHRRRKSFHVRAIANLMAEDIRAQSPDHIAVTGDLVNISLEPEFNTALAWLETLGSGQHVSVVPGNHDAYVPLPWEGTIGKWDDYMRHCAKGAAQMKVNGRFPYMRFIGDVTLIGLSTAVPKPPFIASGTLGVQQLAALGPALSSLSAEGGYRVVLIHHPPLTHQASRRKGLTDAAALTELLVRHGADLVLHGHNHRDMYETLATQEGTAHIFGVPSASGRHGGHRPAAQYNLYDIARTDTGWRCQLTVRGLAENGKSFNTVKELIIAPPTNR